MLRSDQREVKDTDQMSIKVMVMMADTHLYLEFISNTCSLVVYNKVLAYQVLIDFSVSHRVLASPLA